MAMPAERHWQSCSTESNPLGVGDAIDGHAHSAGKRRVSALATWTLPRGRGQVGPSTTALAVCE